GVPVGGSSPGMGCPVFLAAHWVANPGSLGITGLARAASPEPEIRAHALIVATSAPSPRRRGENPFTPRKLSTFHSWPCRLARSLSWRGRSLCGTPRSRQLPAEVDLGPADLLALEGEHLGVAKAAPIGPRALVRDDYLIACLEQAREPVLLDASGVGPAALEVARAVDVHVGGGEEFEVLAQELIEYAAIAGLVGSIGLASKGEAVPGRHVRPFLW